MTGIDECRGSSEEKFNLTGANRVNGKWKIGTMESWKNGDLERSPVQGKNGISKKNGTMHRKRFPTVLPFQHFTIPSFQFGYFIFQYSIIPVPSSLFPK
jgi:hypothetical protein